MVSHKEFQEKSLHNNSNLKVLDLSGIGIPSDLLPSNISKPCEFYLRSCSKIEYINIAESPKDLEVLDISGASNLVKIEEKFFESLVNVRVLNLSETKVKDLPSLSALENLRRLLLSGCLHLEKLPSLTSSKLDLSDCKALTMIEDESFKHLHCLRRLVLSKSKITRLPDLNSLLNLEELNLSGVKSFKKVDFIEHMSKLQDINLSETLLEQLPTLSSLKSLKHLSLRGCGHLESIPPLEALHKLETLDLSQTAVRHLPSLGNLSNLHILLLRDCSNLEDFKKNKMLDMSGVENLPCGISRLTQLEHLALPSTKKNNEAAESNKSNPSLLDANSNHFHLSIHPIEVHDGAGDLLFKKDELIFRDVYQGITLDHKGD
ncbi:uncharacterized protein [Coffea arabica]|uniref:Uncharacterized protein n=1 Tax=Coffea arabica TaxID=13443 RepID=A0ABM4VIQ5_COFAR